MQDQEHETGNKKSFVSLFRRLATAFIIAFFVFFVLYYQIYALIPILLALLLILIFRNAIFSFFIALFISCILFHNLDYFFVHILDHINYTVLAILTVGGVFGVLLAGEGSRDFFIWLRRRAKTFRAKKLLVSFVAIFNFFSSITSVIATNLMLSEDFRNANIKAEDKKDLLKIVLLLGNVACVLVPCSLWWLLYSKFPYFSFTSVLPFLFYPIVVILYTIFNIVLKEGKSEFIIEKRNFDRRKLVFFIVLPILFIYACLIAESIHIWLYDAGVLSFTPLFDTGQLVFCAFFFGAILLFAIYTVSAAVSTKIDANLNKAVELIEAGRKKIGSVLNELASGAKRFTVGKTGINPAVLKRILSGSYIDAHARNYLNSAKYFHSIEPRGSFPRLKTSCSFVSRNIFDGVSRFTDLFLSGMRNILGDVLIFIAVLGLEDLIIGLGVEIRGLHFVLGIQPILPLFIFLFAAFIGYPLGTAWGTFAICFALFIIPLNGLVSPFTLELCIAALISASVFVNQASNVAENVIITSSLTGFSPDYITDSIKMDVYWCFSASAILYAIFGLAAPVLNTITLIVIILVTIILLTVIVKRKK
jgi:hypothetical protein